MGVCWKLGMFNGNSVIFNILYILLVFLFVSRLINTTKTGELSYKNLFAIIDYLPKRMRFYLQLVMIVLMLFIDYMGLQV